MSDANISRWPREKLERTLTRYARLLAYLTDQNGGIIRLPKSVLANTPQPSVGIDSVGGEVVIAISGKWNQ